MQMKISLITRHAITNYGSLLQTYATQIVLRKMGCDVEVIDYIPQDEHHFNIAKSLLRKNEKWNSNIFKRIAYLLIQSPGYLLAGNKFEKLRKTLLNLSDRYTTLDELTKNKPQADIYCTGSDQVWGPIGSKTFDPVYFLSFTGNGEKKVAFGSSFGRVEISSSTIVAYKKMLTKYDAVSVREKSAVDIITNMNLTIPSQVLDPTLLLTSYEWNKLFKKNINKRYVLVYQLHNNSKMDIYAKKFAEQSNLPLIRITPMLHHLKRGGWPIFLPDPEIFLSYIKNAAYMITDSFHGTAFAINFGTQFVNILPEETQTRNQSLLELTNLTERVVRSYEDFSFIEKKINFEPVHRVIVKERERSIVILKSMIFSKGS
jgi:hypothetical protein